MPPDRRQLVGQIDDWLAKRILSNRQGLTQAGDPLRAIARDRADGGTDGRPIFKLRRQPDRIQAEQRIAARIDQRHERTIAQAHRDEWSFPGIIECDNRSWNQR